jgi:hypothetical protein
MFGDGCCVIGSYGDLRQPVGARDRCWRSRCSGAVDVADAVEAFTLTPFV